MILSIILCLSLNSISAQDLNNSDINSISSDINSNINQIANDGTINIEVKDSYMSLNRTWVEEGLPTDKAQITIFDSSNNKVFEGKTNANGLLSVKLAQGNYKVNINLDTYEPYVQNIQLSNNLNIKHIFYPDMLFFVDYNSHVEKINSLMNISKRVCFISTTDYDKTKEWLFDYANFIQLDMYTDGPTYSFNTDVMKESPAYKNYNIAYTFGVYSDALLKAIDLHFVGGSPSNNNVNSLENTYIGSYFQAEDTPNAKVLDKNMANLIDYIKYLINPSKYSNPTLDPTRTPMLASSMGFYHPDLGTLSVNPDQVQINSWILSNPGYNHDGIGGLNWMSENYAEWSKVNANPAKFMQSFEKWYKQNKSFKNSFIVIASYYAGGDLIDSLIRRYEAEGRPAFNVYQSATYPAMSSMLVEIFNASTMGISAVNSLYSWSLDYANMANKSAEKDLSKLDLTILKAVNDISQQGFDNQLGPQMEWTYAVTIPSFEGVFGAVVMSYIDDLGNVHVIDSGVEKLVKMTTGWANLKDKKNSDKKVTVVLYNYPPGKAEIGASYLDVFQSTRDLLELLAKNGYDIGMKIDEIPSVKKLGDIIANFGNKGTWAQGLLNDYVKENWDALNDNKQLISLDEFYSLTSDVNKDLMMQLVDYWGDGLGKIMVYDNKYLVIPGVQFGNVFITFQPSRGWEEVANYHDTTLPPHQQYVAFYKWLDKTHKTDVIINMGTHGTLEFLPGHQIGVQDGDWTFELTLTPTVYPYIVSNPGEAMVARDRLGALMITHMTPAIVASELYGNYSLLSTAILGYKNAIKLNVSSNAESYKEEIIKLAHNVGFAAQGKNQTFDQWLDELHGYLDQLENDFNAIGLHTLGYILSGQNLVEEIITIVSSQTKIYDHITEFLFPSLSNVDYYEEIRGNPQYESFDKIIKEMLYEMVGLIVNETSCDQLSDFYGYDKNSSLYNDSLYIAQILLNIYANNEWNALLKALNGSYIKGGLFADPAYSDSIPTGYNGYATDHTKVPSKASFESAKKIVDLLLVNYYEKHGKWPELTALILWGTEISRTEGIGISEFLYFLGCKPTWTKTGTVDGVELLPLSELKVILSNGTVLNRPRIDVYASMVTSNSDWIRWLVTATNLAFNAPGENTSQNYVKKHYEENPTLNRLFGLPGNVLEGTGMSTFIPNTADWDIDSVNKVLNDIYMNKVSYAWNLDENGDIVISKEEKDYGFLLGKTDLITQNLDSTWRVLDSDDYYDWFGGLLNAANQHGAKPETAFVDIRNKNNYISNDYQSEINFEIRSFLTNKKFLDEYGKTDAGMNAFASKVQNAFGSLIVSGGSLNTQLGGQLADAALYMGKYVDSVTSAAAFSSSAAWMIYYAFTGAWEMTDANGNPVDPSYKRFLTADSLSEDDINKFLDSIDPSVKTKLQDLANEMMTKSIEYGVACCHHTCKNINFNKLMMQISTLSTQDKQKYSDILSQATLTDPIYQADDGSEGEADSSNNENNENDENSGLVNGTTTNNNDQATGGITSAGDLSSTMEANAKSADSSSADSSAQAESNADSSAAGDSSQAYELTKSANKKVASAESSTPAIVIVAVIALIVLFTVGYIKNKKED